MFGFRWPERTRKRDPAGTRKRASHGGMGVRELQIRLDLLVEPRWTRGETLLHPAKSLAGFNLVEQNRFLVAAERLALVDRALAYRFCHTAVPALAILPEGQWTPWLDLVLERYRSQGSGSAIAVLNDAEGFARRHMPSSPAPTLAKAAPVLERFLLGLSGAPPTLTPAPLSYTDTRAYHLPPVLSPDETGSTGLTLYKSMALHQWAQNRFGTWTIDPDETARRYPDPQRALRLFHRLETIRLDACLARELPGAARELARLRPSVGEVPDCWARAARRLRSARVDVGTSLEFLPGVYSENWEPPAASYEGVLRPEAVRRAGGDREYQPEPERHAAIATGSATPQADQTRRVSPGNPRSASPREFSEEQPSRGLHSADGPEAPPEPGPERSPDASTEESPVRAHSDPPDELPDRDSVLYDEWDCTLQRYRKDWCRVRVIDCPAGAGSFVHETLGRHRGLVSQLRRTFEALRREDLRLTRQVFGDDLDLDAVVEAHADTLSGNGPGDGLYIRTERSGRSVAALILLDMSASTDGRVNRIERESLVLIGEALEALRDRYAIYGFSSRSRTDCTLHRIKAFGEPNAETVQARIAGATPRGATRMGAAIRHASQLLSREEVRTRLLLLLTDGRPEDRDGYQGDYAIEDTRRALIEARDTGLHPYCVTIDRAAPHYLPHLFGAHRYTLVRDLTSLPRRLAETYRKILS